MLIILVSVSLPVLLAYALVAADIRMDLSDLKPRSGIVQGDARVVGWADLRGENKAGAKARAPIRILGYMMDGYQPSRDDDNIGMFILMPEAGQFLHPAHRIPSGMIEVRLAHPAQSKYRSLVWTTGFLATAPGPSDREKADFVIENAQIEPAAERDIAKWFRP